jgi:hypothetical protein
VLHEHDGAASGYTAAATTRFAAETRTLLASLSSVRAHACYSRPGPHDPPLAKPGSRPMIEFARSDLAIPWSSDYNRLLGRIPADGSALVCCSQPRDDVVLDL